jgi:hypothetical protein
MLDYSRRAFLESVVATVGVALLAPLPPLQAQPPQPGELAISGFAHPALARVVTHFRHPCKSIGLASH